MKKEYWLWFLIWIMLSFVWNVYADWRQGMDWFNNVTSNYVAELVAVATVLIAGAIWKKWNKPKPLDLLKKQNQPIQLIIGRFNYGEREIFANLKANYVSLFDNNDASVKSLVKKGVIEQELKRTPEHNMRYSLYHITPKFVDFDI